jgi:hypothetical protein
MVGRRFLLQRIERLVNLGERFRRPELPFQKRHEQRTTRVEPVRAPVDLARSLGFLTQGQE